MQTINDRIGIVLERSKKSKTAFGESLNVSQQYISKLVKTGNPSELLINDICEKYHIRKEWLLNGTEPMEINLTRSEKITDFAADLLKDEEDCYRFFEDIFTIHELQAVAQRLAVARLLQKKVTYQEIAERTGARTATISRVNRCLTYGAGGYQLILGKTKFGDETSEDNP